MILLKELDTFLMKNYWFNSSYAKNKIVRA